MEKLSAILLSTLLLAPSPAFAFPYGRTSGSFEQCDRYRYTERYVPGYYNQYGNYVGGYVKTDKVKVPCNNFASMIPNQGAGNSTSTVTSVVLPLLVNLLQNR